MEDKDAIKFFKLKDAFGEFSNFYRASFTFDNRVWPTSEHCYQAFKYDNFEIQEKIRLSKTPRIAADLGRDSNNGYKIKENWDDIKVDIMEKVVTAKFSQNNELKELLLSTKNRKIVEHSKTDFFWADGKDGSGKNMLGEVLMEVREDFKFLGKL